MKRKILYVKRGLFSHTNTSVGHLLRRHFPQHEVVVLDVTDDLLRGRQGIRLVNWLIVFLMYWKRIFTRRNTREDCFFRTPYIARTIKRLVGEALAGREAEFDFSFQTSSLYDASVPGLPHFVYTDHTHKTNLYYAAFDVQNLFASSWIVEEAKIYHNAAFNFTMSEHVRRSMIEHYACASDKISCVLAGSNTDIRPKVLENDEFRNKHILFVGVDWKRKGGDSLILAFKRLLIDHPDAKLTIVGCSPDLECPNCEIVGRIPVESVARYYTRASIFCFPTRIEPFGIVPIEAFAHKLPVITSNIGAMPQIVENEKSGFLVDPDDPEALAHALDFLLKNPTLCREMGEAGYEHILKNFTWEAVGDRMKAKIEEIAGVNALV